MTPEHEAFLKKQGSSLTGNLILSAFTIVAVAGLMMLYGIILSTLWFWFVTPALHLPAISGTQGVGLWIVVKLLGARGSASEIAGNSTEEKFVTVIGVVGDQTMYMLFLFFLGYIFHLFL